MKIILLKDITKIGRKGEIKEISDGYAINFVIPKGLAVKATSVEIKKIENQQKIKEDEQRLQDELLSKSLRELDALTITIKEKTNEKGSLFVGIHAEKIAKLLTEKMKMEFKDSWIILDKPLKEIGNYVIDIKAGEKKGKVKIVVESI